MVDHGDVVVCQVAIFSLRTGVKFHTKGRSEVCVARCVDTGCFRLKRPNHTLASTIDASKVDDGLNVKRLGKVDAFVGPCSAASCGIGRGQCDASTSERFGVAKGGIGGQLGSGRHRQCHCNCEG